VVLAPPGCASFTIDFVRTATAADLLAAVSRRHLGSCRRNSAIKVLRMQDAAGTPIFRVGEYPHAFVHDVSVTFLFEGLNSRLYAAR
jgi:hypothetical protein